MKREPICEFCGEFDKCVCSFSKCALCGVEYSNFDPNEEHGMYEYRGALGCNKCIEEVRTKRDYQRAQVIETTEHAIKSQQGGEWMNGGYKTMKVNTDGSPQVKPKEPLALKDYENGKL